MTNSRRNRDSFTRILIAICVRLDDKHSGTFSWTHPFVHIECQSSFAVKSVWVVGSFARGAPTCSDLDLVADIDWHAGPIALPNAVLKALSLRHKGASLYDGTPGKNSSQIAFNDAILIWDQNGNDWRSAINNIGTDPNAGHFSRAADEIPFRPDQLSCDIKEMDNLLKLRDEGLIRWDFTPFSSTAIQGPPTKHQTQTLGLFSSCGARTQFLLPHLLPYFNFHQWPTVYRQAQLNRSTFQLADSVVSIGRPTVAIRLLNTLTTARLMIVPHMHVGAVNGVWCIERGDLHPLTLASERLNIWALFRDSGQLDFYERIPLDSAGALDCYKSAVAIDLFTSLEAAQRWIVTAQDDDGCVVKPVSLTPQALLACIAAVDVVSIDITDFAMTRKGAITLGVMNTVNFETVFTILADTKSNQKLHVSHC